jgi:hypothetical protein
MELVASFSIIGVPVVPVFPVFPLFFYPHTTQVDLLFTRQEGDPTCKFLSGLEYWKLEQLEQLEQNS